MFVKAIRADQCKTVELNNDSVIAPSCNRIRRAHHWTCLRRDCGASAPPELIPLPALKWLHCCSAGRVWTEGKPTLGATQGCISDSSLGNTQNHSAHLNTGFLQSVLLTYYFNSVITGTCEVAPQTVN